jgi:xanthine dehydrogenase accessory factor
MDSVDLEVLRKSAEWLAAGRRVLLVTVVKTWGSSPRPPGALLAVRDDGHVVGSVSGGCIEDDIVERSRREGAYVKRPQTVTYGVSAEDARKFGLPCDLDSAKVALMPARAPDNLAFDGQMLTTVHGPRYRMLVIGAGQLSKYLAQIAVGLDYQVTVCDPREEYTETWDIPGVTLVKTMPDDAVVAMKLDERCAVVALTHDPKLDDLALMEALKSPAFYVGALGSRANNTKRRKRLEEFDLTREQITRLHGPIGLYIGSRTPPEIAISILAEITAAKNGVALPDVAQVAAAKEKLGPSVACATTDA